MTDTEHNAAPVPIQVTVKAYPRGWDAIWHGWLLGFGMLSGACALAAIGLALAKATGAA